jgi:acyl-CoA reductase-like NAD-dependent aldehyde dehydrogenase
LAVMKFSTEEEAIEMANDSIYGLAAAVFTSEFRSFLPKPDRFRRVGKLISLL